jgi:hypothetical protein
MHALCLFLLEFRTYSRDTILEDWGDGPECVHHVGWSRVECG